ncbi:LuxR C-terminal-related transcriptional regulator [Plantactinospora sp. WMMB334]|uniref:LuxR C-terminal-related transcriptional regulator n=1 Tax=Plantactinospora sp. WMMB334 TaxID=3404119 RepID=UPI003B94EA7B
MPSLVPWGYTPDADLVYRTVVTFGPATAGELCTALGMPVRRVAAALDELASIDAIGRRPGSSPRSAAWAATPPAEVVAALQRKRQAAVPGSRADSPLRKHLLPLGTEVGYLPSRAQARARLAELNAVVSHEHLAMHPEPAFDAESMRSALPMDRMALSRGVHMRILGVGQTEPDPLAAYRGPPAEPVPEYRTAPSMPMKLIVIDRKVAFFPVDAGNLERGYLEIAQPPVVSALVDLFEQHWQSARDRWEWAIPQAALTPREHTLITLLAQGHTDASAARRMHLGLRTVGYVVRRLMDRFDVENRFQLGLVLGGLRAAELSATGTDNPEEQ